MSAFVTADELLSIDEGRQSMATRYSMDRLRLRAIRLVVWIALVIAFGPFGGAVELRGVVDGVSGVWRVQILLFFVALAVAVAIAEGPFVYMGSFVLPHRYDLSRQSLRQWLTDVAKGAAIGAILFFLTVEVLYSSLRWTPDYWWLWSGLAFAALSVVLSALAPVLILPLFFTLSPLHDANLDSEIRLLAERAGTCVRSVCTIDLSSKSSAANAAVIGLGQTRKIVLGDTLLESFPRPEIEVVVAHEIGHHVHRDLPAAILVDSLLTLAGFFVANLALHAAAGYWHFAGVWDLGAVPVLVATMSVWSTVSGVFSNWYSRYRESAADSYSLKLTGHGVAFVNSEIRLTNQNLSRLRPPVWLELLSYTHPAPWRRIAMGEKYLERQAAE